MWTPSERPWLTAALAGVALTLAATLVAALTPMPELAEPPPAARSLAIAMAAPAEECAADAVALDVLREDTSMGDPQAALTLVAALLDRYERVGNSNDLSEAVQWIDRGWAEGHYQQSGLATRVYEQHCETDAMRWHWLCEHGE